MVADKRISELDLAPDLSLDDVMPMVDVSGDVTYKFTFTQLMAFISANAQLGANITFGTASIPADSTGKDGDLYIKTNTNQFAQRLSGHWTVVYTITPSINGNVITFGSADPTNPATTGNIGDVYINTTGAKFYQQKIVSSVNTWVLQFTMATGPAGPRGSSVLNGTANPTISDGQNGDFWINTATNTLFGPKASGTWPAGVSLAPAKPNQLLYGTTVPDNTLNGINGDFWINSGSWFIYGPKASGVWPAGQSIVGPDGADGNTVLYGAIAPVSGLGNNGDFYINTATNFIYGPKASGAWPAGTSLIGPTGPGVPIGGTTGQVLAKIDGTNFNDHWIDPPATGPVINDTTPSGTTVYSSSKTEAVVAAAIALQAKKTIIGSFQSII